MANEEPTFESRLEYIAHAQIHSTFHAAISSTVSLAAKTAEQALALKIPELLPAPLPEQQWMQQINARDIPELGEDVGRLYSATKALHQAIQNVAKEPSDQNDRINKQKAVSKYTRLFIHYISPFLIATTHAQYQDKIEEANQYVEQSRAVLNHISKIEMNAREAASKVGVDVHSTDFGIVASRYSRRAAIWLGATIAVSSILIVAVIVIAIAMYNIEYKSDMQMVQILVSKLIGLSAIYFMLVLSARSYKVNANLAETNRHRANALASFQTFAGAALDEQTKNAVLLESTRCIFGQMPTGYLSGDDSNTSPQIIEVLKTFQSSK